MPVLYNTALNIGQRLLSAVGRRNNQKPDDAGKLRKFIDGHAGLMRHIASTMDADRRDLPTYWFHAASLGEFGVARPVIKRLREQERCRIVLTFFSSTGYEAIHPRRQLAGVDHVFYLPLDTPSNAARFLDIVRPQKAIFMISEYWLNYLNELKRRRIPTFLVSAIINTNAPFFRWYGGAYRKALDTYTRIMVLNGKSRLNLERIGCTRVTETGDPLFDNAIALAQTPWKDEIIEHFGLGRELFIAGSVSDDKDLELVSTTANRHTDLYTILVPHEIRPDTVDKIKASLNHKALAYSECTPATDFTGVRTLIIDFVGALGYLYRYGRWAYIGGGFTPYLHSIIEATVYGLPTAFGPNIERKTTPTDLIDIRVGRIVTTADELDSWLSELRSDPSLMAWLRKSAIKYTRHNRGATEYIVNILTQTPQPATL